MGAFAIWSSSSTGCERDNPFDLQCQTAFGDQAVDKPGCRLEGPLLPQRRISLHGSDRCPQWSRNAGARRAICACRHSGGLPFCDGLGASKEVTARKSRLGGVGQISTDKYPRVVYAVAVDLKKH